MSVGPVPPAGPPGSPEAARLDAARARFFTLHAEDPRLVLDEGREVSFAWAYHGRLERWLLRLDPGASAPLRLAAMCQHVGRHTLLRADFPEGVFGYKKWRATAAQRHAATAEQVLREAGWGDEVIARVRDLLTKKGLARDPAGRDPEAQRLEDAVCLTFLEGELADFAAKHPEEKVADILRKSWAKMSATGHATALALIAGVPPALRAMVERALEPHVER